MPPSGGAPAIIDNQLGQFVHRWQTNSVGSRIKIPSTSKLLSRLGDSYAATTAARDPRSQRYPAAHPCRRDDTGVHATPTHRQHFPPGQHAANDIFAGSTFGGDAIKGPCSRPRDLPDRSAALSSEVAWPDSPAPARRLIAGAERPVAGDCRYLGALSCAVELRTTLQRLY